MTIMIACSTSNGLDMKCFNKTVDCQQWWFSQTLRPLLGHDVHIDSFTACVRYGKGELSTNPFEPKDK